MLWKTYDVPSSSSSYSSSLNHHLNKSKSKTCSGYKINVTVRFKPCKEGTTNATNSRDYDSSQSGREDSVILPLHQRLALIRLEHKLDSNRAALNILKEEGEWFNKEKWLTLTATDEFGDEQLQGRDYTLQDRSQPPLLSHGVHEIDCQNNNVVLVDPIKGLRNFQFDCVLPLDCTQNSVYIKSTKPLVCDLINGTNASCLVYGVTGSGKTYTMFGPPHKSLLEREELYGIIPRACRDLFDVLNYRREHLSVKIESTVAVSYIEVFGNRITDLLRTGVSCFSNKAASSHGFVLDGAAEVNVSKYEDIVRELKIGEKKKRRAATSLNAHSSRAHSIFIVRLNQTCISTGINRVSKLFLVDLGGSEQTKKSNIVAGTSQHTDISMKTEKLMSQGYGGDTSHLRNHNEDRRTTFSSTGFVKSDRMREAVHINLGLMSLKKCVTALVSGKTNYIPYADSKLTMMLSTALGGNCKTSVIICASKSKRHDFAETVASLKFGLSCRSIMNNVEAGNDFLTKLLKSLDSEIAKCEEEIKKKERWEVREEKRMDPLAQSNSLEMEGFGGIEIRKTTVLVGAEEERKRLENLIRKKLELTGISINQNLEGPGGSIGFGVAFNYGFGKKKDDHPNENNSRFQQFVRESDIPDAVKKAGGRKQGWNQYCNQNSDNNNDEEVRKLQKMKKNSTLAYSGISA